MPVFLALLMSVVSFAAEAPLEGNWSNPATDFSLVLNKKRLVIDDCQKVVTPETVSSQCTRGSYRVDGDGVFSERGQRIGRIHAEDIEIYETEEGVAERVRVEKRGPNSGSLLVLAQREGP